MQGRPCGLCCCAARCHPPCAGADSRRGLLKRVLEAGSMPAPPGFPIRRLGAAAGPLKPGFPKTLVGRRWLWPSSARNVCLVLWCLYLAFTTPGGRAAARQDLPSSQRSRILSHKPLKSVTRRAGQPASVLSKCRPRYGIHHIQCASDHLTTASRCCRQCDLCRRVS